MTSWAGPFWPKGHNLNKLSRSLLVMLHTNYRLKALWFQTRKCLCVPYISLRKICDAEVGPFWAKGQDLHILGRGLLGDAA